jgi:hypothetical protein
VRYRATARKTWLGIQSMSELPRHSVAYRFFVDGPCDTCAQEEETNGDMVVRQRNSSPDASSNPDATWLHPTFLSDYADPSINYKTQWAPEVCRPFFFFSVAVTRVLCGLLLLMCKRYGYCLRGVVCWPIESYNGCNNQRQKVQPAS